MIIRAAAVCFAVFVAQQAGAAGVFLPAGDARLRDALTLLADRGLVRLQVNDWPLARQDVADALAGLDVADIEEPALRSAFARLSAAASLPVGAGDWKLREIRVSAGQPGLLRSEDTLGRENGELTAVGGATHERYSITIAATGVVDASDRQDLRLDGSDVSVRWGNWLFSVNQMDRWWGPGHDGGLILSSNARPMPAVSIDRIRSMPFDVPVLRWLGPWRFTSFVGVGESHRPDVDRPLFLGMRVSIKPAPQLEIGLSRSAQFCGKERPCGLASFGRLLIGRDNVGTRGLEDPDDEPGNQMSGVDVRFASPWRLVPVALYGQLIGEDNSDASIPIRYMYQGGAEGWWALDSGAVLRAHVEHSDTSTGWYKPFRFNDPQPGFRYDYGYRNHVFFAGYRYRGRNIGHTTDADSETTAVGLSLTTDSGQRWAALVRFGNLDRKGAPDPYNRLTSGSSRYNSFRLSWDGSWGGQGMGLQVGYEEQSSSAISKRSGLFGFLQLRKVLD